ncbi:MAG: hypothetical protein QOI76_4316 [Frankiales bacterium]|nr:hypothetical protein [Frankiales bacterium]
MPLGQPPSPGELAQLPRVAVRGLRLHRVFSASRASPWWFASLPPGGMDPDPHGRFDLPEPAGACYLALTPLAAVLEAFQHFSGRLPEVELRKRRLVTVVAPPRTPAAANLTAQASRGLGVTAALWAGGDRALTQAWAAALHRAGWRALHHGISHDPAGRLRAVTLLDQAGQHLPFDDPQWLGQVATLHDDAKLHRALARFGITVSRSDVMLPIVTLDDSGLLHPRPPSARPNG